MFDPEQFFWQECKEWDGYELDYRGGDPDFTVYWRDQKIGYIYIMSDGPMAVSFVDPPAKGN